VPTTTEKLYRCGRCESVTSAEHHYKSPLGISCRRATWCHVAEAPSESVCSVCSLLSNFVCGLVVRGGRTFSPWVFPPGHFLLPFWTPCTNGQNVSVAVQSERGDVHGVQKREGRNVRGGVSGGDVPSLVVRGTASFSYQRSNSVSYLA